jgi:hypothetical protein
MVCSPSTVAGQATYKAGGNTMKRLLLEPAARAPRSCSTTPTSTSRSRPSPACGSQRPDLHRAYRAIAHRSRYQELVDRLGAMAAALSGGRPAVGGQ